MTLKERAILGKKALAKQRPVSYEEMKAKIEWLKANSKSDKPTRKKRPDL